MAWDDRKYNQRSGSGSGSNYLANPLGMLGFSVPFGTWFGARVRLHFWLLLSFLFNYVNGMRTGDFYWATVICILTLVALMCHEFGHRAFARWVDGDHDEFLLWPAGGMIPVNVPPTAKATFIGHVGGIIVNLALYAVSIGAIFAVTRMATAIPWNPLLMLMGKVGTGAGIHSDPTAYLETFALINLGIVFMNLLPYYWFDGGYLLQAILWPFLNLYRAINITCIVGMVLAVPMFVLSLAGPSLFGMIFWALLFASSYSKRQQLKAAGTGEFEDSIAWSASTREESPHKKIRKGKGWFKRAAKRARREQQEQAQIDAILAKVHDKGLHALTWGEKRALRKATERQRQEDLAERL